MEIFADFGLFELALASGLAALGRLVLARRPVGLAFTAASVLAPVLMLFAAPEGRVRWLAAVCLGTALVNAWIIGTILRRPAGAAQLVEWTRAPNAASMTGRPATATPPAPHAGT